MESPFAPSRELVRFSNACICLAMAPDGAIVAGGLYRCGGLGKNNYRIFCPFFCLDGKTNWRPLISARNVIAEQAAT
jgi:hypothetical protein